MNVSYCGKTEFPIKSCETHFHKEWEVIYNISGKNCSEVDKTTYNIAEGDIMVIPPGIVHNGNSDELYTDMYVQAKELDFQKSTIVHDYDGNIRELFLILHKTFMQKDCNYVNICDSLLDAICQYIKKYMSSHYRHTFVYDVKDCIYENVSNPDFKLLQLSERIGYNIDYIRRNFVTETGKTPHEYLLELRLSLAKKLLLQETFISIEDVAAKCGFADAFYFSTIFKKKIGLTPKAYRNKKLIHD